MRLLNLVLVATLALPMGVTAQTRGHRLPPMQTVPPVGPPQIGVPLPSLGLPAPTSGARHIVPFHDGEFPGTAFARARNSGASFSTSFGGTPFGTRSFVESSFVRRSFVGTPFGRRSFVGAPIIFYVPQYVFPIAPPAPALPASDQIDTQLLEAPLTTGSLILQMEPPTAQVFVDGYYLGTSEDFDGRRGELALEPGPHKVELGAPGYQSVTVDVRITANQRMKYLNAMKPVASTPPPPPAAPIQPKTIYLVPGCYLGDVPPKEAGLPATCDVTRAVTFAR